MITHPLFEGLRNALCDDPGIAQRLDQWKSEPAVFTRRPVPKDAPRRIAIVNTGDLGNWDGLNTDRPLWSGTIGFYGVKAEPGSDQDDTRTVEEAADLAREKFHRQRFGVQVAGFSVIEVVAGGPFPGPTDDDNEVARLLSLRIRLRRN